MANCFCSDSAGLGDGVGIETGMISFSVEELNTYMDAFSKRKILGRGAFGSVYRGIISGRMERNIIEREVAVKLFRRREGARTHWEAEKEYLPRLLHQNIIELIGYCEALETLYLVYPFMKNGTILGKLAGLDWKKTLKIIKGTASAIQMLHGQEPPLIHRDLKLDNVLLDKDFTPKLADFGTVTLEDVHSQSRTRPHDIYSLGVIILQLIMKVEKASIPGVRFWHISDRASRMYVDNKRAVHFELTKTGCSISDATAVTELALDCVKVEAEERPIISQVVDRLAKLQGKKGN